MSERVFPAQKDAVSGINPGCACSSILTSIRVVRCVHELRLSRRVRAGLDMAGSLQQVDQGGR